MSEVIEMTVLDPAEKSRTYKYPHPTLTNVLVEVRYEKVTHFLARPSGSHRLKTADGMMHIAPPGFVGLDIDVTDWTL